MNTTIIISELSKDDFVKAQGESLSLVDQIKLAILNVDLQGDEDFFLNRITTWSNLPFLSRVVIILKDETTSKLLYEYISKHREALKLNEGVKVSIQPNLLQRSRSFDGKIDDDLLVNDLRRFKATNKELPDDIEEYNEPTPKKFDYRDLGKLGIDIDKLNGETTSSGSKDDFDIGGGRSDTKTLFRPSLSVATNVGKSQSSIQSPTITLDESG